MIDCKDVPYQFQEYCNIIKNRHGFRLGFVRVEVHLIAEHGVALEFGGLGDTYKLGMFSLYKFSKWERKAVNISNILTKLHAEATKVSNIANLDKTNMLLCVSS